jgi:hypothetical protein
MKPLSFFAAVFLPFTAATLAQNNPSDAIPFGPPTHVIHSYWTSENNIDTLVPIAALAGGSYATTYTLCQLLTGHGPGKGQNCHPYAMLSVSGPVTIWSSIKAYNIWFAGETTRMKSKPVKGQRQDL